MSTEPVCLIQWLDPGEYPEVVTAWANYSPKVDIRLERFFPGSKEEILDTIYDWLDGNDNAQLLYIGSHGDERELGPSSVNPGLTWAELADALSHACVAPALILGACHSSHIADAWSPIHSGGPPAAWITAFRVAVKPPVLEAVLECALDMGGFEEMVFMDEELERLIKAANGGPVAQFYPARTKTNDSKYVDVSRFQEEVGSSLKEVLQASGSRLAMKSSGR